VAQQIALNAQTLHAGTMKNIQSKEKTKQGFFSGLFSKKNSSYETE
jgi:hypothetical protein